MVTLEEFTSGPEFDRHTRDVILATLKNRKDTKKSRDELVFNRYTFQFIYEKNKVVMYDDAAPDDNPLTLSLDDFFNTVQNTKSVAND